MKKIIAILVAIMLVASVAVFTAAAAEEVNSPVEIKYYSMTAEAIGAGEASVTPAKVEIGSDGTATFTATEKGGKFIRWEFHCEYDVVSGTVTDDVSYDKVVVLRPKSDIHGVAYFEGKATPDQKDTSTTAPKTGDMTLVFVGILLMAIGAGVFAVKKIKE